MRFSTQARWTRNSSLRHGNNWLSMQSACRKECRKQFTCSCCTTSYPFSYLAFLVVLFAGMSILLLLLVLWRPDIHTAAFFPRGRKEFSLIPPSHWNWVSLLTSLRPAFPLTQFLLFVYPASIQYPISCDRCIICSHSLWACNTMTLMTPLSHLQCSWYRRHNDIEYRLVLLFTDCWSYIMWNWSFIGFHFHHFTVFSMCIFQESMNLFSSSFGLYVHYLLYLLMCLFPLLPWE